MAIFCIDASEKEDFANWKKEHDSELLDKVAEKFISWDSKVKGTREDGVCFFTIENILQVIARMKAEVSKNANES